MQWLLQGDCALPADAWAVIVRRIRERVPGIFALPMALAGGRALGWQAPGDSPR
jgi:hypothetical protein